MIFRNGNQFPPVEEHIDKFFENCEEKKQSKFVQI